MKWLEKISFDARADCPRTYLFLNLKRMITYWFKPYSFDSWFPYFFCVDYLLLRLLRLSHSYLLHPTQIPPTQLVTCQHTFWHTYSFHYCHLTWLSVSSSSLLVSFGGLALHQFSTLHPDIFSEVQPTPPPSSLPYRPHSSLWDSRATNYKAGTPRNSR